MPCIHLVVNSKPVRMETLPMQVRLVPEVCEKLVLLSILSHYTYLFSNFTSQNTKMCHNIIVYRVGHPEATVALIT